MLWSCGNASTQPILTFIHVEHAVDVVGTKYNLKAGSDMIVTIYLLLNAHYSESRELEREISAWTKRT